MNKTIISGSRNIFGPRTSEVDTAVVLPDSDVVRTMIQPIYTTASSATLVPTSEFDANDTYNVIPANSLIRHAAIYVEDAFTSTSSATGIDAGLVQADDGSTEIDFNGFIEVGGVGAKANLVATSWDEGDGALIGAETGDKDGVIYAKWAGGTDTLTGTAVIVVSYIPPLTEYLADKT